MKATKSNSLPRRPTATGEDVVRARVYPESPRSISQHYLDFFWSILWLLLAPPVNFALLFLGPSWNLSKEPPVNFARPRGPSWRILGPFWAPWSISHYFSGPVLEFVQRAPSQFRNTSLGPLGTFLAPFSGPQSVSHSFSGQCRNIFWHSALLEHFGGPLGRPSQFRITFLGPS